MSTKKGLTREEGTVRPRTGRLERNRRGDRSSRLHRTERVNRVNRADREDEDSAFDEGARHSQRRDRGSRNITVKDELMDLNRGGAYMAAESVAMSLDVFSRVLRGVVDRAFDDDYNQPGDIIRNVSNEADLAVYDLVDELRHVPRHLQRRFQDGIRSPRADRGERDRRRHKDPESGRGHR